ncbi:MAG: hypothetical protein K0S53_2008 [Bacteroidetes bacterium]|nr:hypothetical protein [Bacteroidota bacterium]
MLLIYTHTITERFRYVLDIVFDTIIRTQFSLTTDREEFQKSSDPKLAYTKSQEGFDLFIRADDLLFEETIRKASPMAEKTYVDFPKFFKSSDKDLLGYDLFAMVFYFSVRYEEYLPSEKDEHQRFKAENSLAYQYGCLQIPFLNLAIQQFGVELKQRFPELKFEERPFNFLSTIDIDNAFAYAHKGIKRNIGGMAKDLLSLKLKDVVRRLGSNLNERKDPYNTFEYIHSLSKETQTALQYFVLIGDYSRYDKNPDYRNEGFRKLLKSLATNYSIGLHPSYESYSQPEKIGMEKKRLEEIIGRKVTSARCHFLRVNLPETYRVFIKNGITDDYTMIYASQAGFRTGLCVPYKWFDLKKNCRTDLTLHTSVIMEGTLRDYNKLSADEAKDTSLALLEEVKKQRGQFVSIFHNDSFVPEQADWINVYKELLKNSNSFHKTHNS